jgi:hypothetical protein
MKETFESIQARGTAAAERRLLCAHHHHRLPSGTVSGIHEARTARAARRSMRVVVERRIRRESEAIRTIGVAKLEMRWTSMLASPGVRQLLFLAKRRAQDARVSALRQDLIAIAIRCHLEILTSIDRLDETLVDQVDEMYDREDERHARNMRDVMTKNAEMIERHRRIDMQGELWGVGYVLEIGRRSPGSPLTLLSHEDCRGIVLLLFRYSIVSREIGDGRDGTDEPSHARVMIDHMF